MLYMMRRNHHKCACVSFLGFWGIGLIMKWKWIEMTGQKGKDRPQRDVTHQFWVSTVKSAQTKFFYWYNHSNHVYATENMPPSIKITLYKPISMFIDNIETDRILSILFDDTGSTNTFENQNTTLHLQSIIVEWYLTCTFVALAREL